MNSNTNSDPLRVFAWTSEGTTQTVVSEDDCEEDTTCFLVKPPIGPHVLAHWPRGSEAEQR